MVFNVGVRYRLAQFWWAISARSLKIPVYSEIKAHLSARELELFSQFSISDQRHGYAVYQSLIEAGYDQPDLLTAGILHDIGKVHIRLTVWEKSLVVICERLFANRIHDWGAGRPQGWKRPFVVRTHHAEWGAQMCEVAGSSDLVINLIRRHQDPLPENPEGYEDELLRRLQWADNQN